MRGGGAPVRADLGLGRRPRGRRLRGLTAGECEFTGSPAASLGAGSRRPRKWLSLQREDDSAVPSQEIELDVKRVHLARAVPHEEAPVAASAT